jgi:hypothetical protein
VDTCGFARAEDGLRAVRSARAVMMGVLVLLTGACANGHSHRAAPSTSTTNPPPATASSTSLPPTSTTPTSAVVPSTSVPPITPEDRADATQVIVYEPFTNTRTVTAGFTVVGCYQNADCYEGAISSPRRDAFRCFPPVGSQQDIGGDPCILDPVGPSQLACPTAGEPYRVEIVTPAPPFLHHANTGSADTQTGLPWLIKLQDGQLCGDATGGTAYFATIGQANWAAPKAGAGDRSSDRAKCGPWPIPVAPHFGATPHPPSPWPRSPSPGSNSS